MLFKSRIFSLTTLPLFLPRGSCQPFFALLVSVHATSGRDRLRTQMGPKVSPTQKPVTKLTVGVGELPVEDPAPC